MNTLESQMLISPMDIEEECSKFVIDDITKSFVLTSITKPNQLYTFSFWIKSEAPGRVRVAGMIFETSSESWLRCISTFTTAREDFAITFQETGTYYIYHPQLELGNQATDWTPSPEDVDEGISDAKNDALNAQNTADGAHNRVNNVETTLAKLERSIAMLVTSGDGSSLMTQTEDGWRFNMGDWERTLNELGGDLEALVNQVGNIDKALNVLEQRVDDDPLTTEHVEIGTFEDEPCIAFSESDSDYRLLITNKRFVYIHGGYKNAAGKIVDYSLLTTIDTDGLTTDNITIKKEIRQGGFVWVTHGNGNLGLTWKGVTS